MTPLTLVAALPLCALLFLSMKETGVKGHALFLVAVGTLAALPLLSSLASLASRYTALIDNEGAREFCVAAIKVLGVGWLTHIACDVCTESGAPSLASRVELCGRIEILLLCFPYVEELVKSVLTLT